MQNASCSKNLKGPQQPCDQVLSVAFCIFVMVVLSCKTHPQRLQLGGLWNLWHLCHLLFAIFLPSSRRELHNFLQPANTELSSPAFKPQSSSQNLRIHLFRFSRLDSAATSCSSGCSSRYCCRAFSATWNCRAIGKITEKWQVHHHKQRNA